MHKVQEKILYLLNKNTLKELMLRYICTLIGESLAQKIRHHLEQLIKRELIVVDTKTKIISRKSENSNRSIFVPITITGSANCGKTVIDDDENIIEYLKVSKRFLTRKQNTYILTDEGGFINRAYINGEKIEYNYSVNDKRNKRIVLELESIQSYLFIFMNIVAVR